MADITRILAEVVLQSKEAIAAWKAFGDAGVREFQRIERGAQQATSNMTASLGRLQARMRSFSQSTQEVGNSIKRFGAGFSLAVGAPLLLAMRKATTEAKAAQESIARLDSTVKGVGVTVGGTSAEMQEWASTMQQSVAVSDEALLDMQSTLLKFDNMDSPKIFKRARDAVIDFAQHTGQDVPAAAQQFGQALNDPIRGLRALRQAGITFTQEQKAQIKGWVESGQIIKAQDLILKEFEQTYGQVAEDFAKTDFGKQAIAANQLSDALEEVGNQLIPIETMFLNMIRTVLDGFLALPEAVQQFIVWLGVIAIAAGPVIVALGGLVWGFGQLAGAFALIVPLFAPLGGLMFTLGTAIGYILRIIGLATVAVTGVGLWPVIVAAALGALIVAVVTHWDQIVAFVQASIEKIAGFFVGMWSGLSAAWNQLMSDWTVVWDEFLASLGRGWDAFVQGIRGSIDAILGWLNGLVQKAKDAWEWVKKAASAKQSDTAAAGGGGGGFARGGRVRGRGGIDNVAAWLTSGEFVHRVAAVRKYGTGFMSAVNSLRYPASLARGYAMGGVVRAPGMRFATGGMVPGGARGERGFTLVIDGHTFPNLRAPADTADDLLRFGRERQLRSAGKAPTWFK